MLRVAVFSESAITFDGHGVHSAFLECRNLLRETVEVELVDSWELRPSDILHVHSAGPGALAILISHTGPKVVSAHVTADSFLGSIEYANHFMPTIARYLKFFYEKADLILAVSVGTKNYLQQELHVSKPIEVMPNTINANIISELRGRRNELRAKFHWSPHQPVILGVGQVQPRKGIDDFVAVAKAMPAENFIWVGGFLFGPLSADRRRLQGVIQDAPVNLMFTGKLARPVVYEHYIAADIFLLPSHQETFGLAVLEASTAGLPLILRDLPSYRSIFGNSYISVSDGDYTTAVSALLEDCERFDLYSKRALAVAEGYNSKKHATELVTMYRLAKQLSVAKRL